MLKKTHRKLSALSLKQSVFLKALRERSKGRGASYCDDAEDHSSDIDDPVATSSPAIAASILKGFQPQRVIHVGCGTGALLAALRERGVDVFGLECADAELRSCWAKRLPVRKFDLQKDRFVPDVRFDLSVSIGVAERLPESMSSRYVDLLSGSGDRIIFAAAGPGQGGLDHINEQPPEYWIAKFYERSLIFDECLSDRWRAEWKASGAVDRCIHTNLMLFSRRINGRAEA